MAFYTSYADHMWRSYIRNRGTPLTDLSAPCRANIAACETVFNRVPEAWKSIATVYYSAAPTVGTERLQQFCRSNRRPYYSAWSAIHNLQASVALERGLIDRDHLPSGWSEQETEPGATPPDRPDPLQQNICQSGR